MNKKTLTLVMAVIMLVTACISGCGSSTDSGDGKTSTQEATTLASGQETAQQGSGEPVTWETADLSWKKDTSPVKMSFYCDISWYTVQEWGKDDVSKEIEKLTGVSLEVSKRNEDNQLSVMLAANDLPDIIVMENNAIPARFFKTGISYAWDELISQYAPEFLGLLDPTEIINNTVSDGHFYTLKSHYKSDKEWADDRMLPSPGATGFSIRSDILEEMGNPKLDSIEDLMTIYDQVNQKYPNMAKFILSLQNAPIFMEWMDLVTYRVHYDDASGKVIHALNRPKELWTDYIKLMNGLYTKGYLNPENFSYQNDQFNQVITSGNVFSVSGPGAGNIDSINTAFYKNNMKGEMTWVKPLTWKGQSTYRPLDTSTGWTTVVISKNCKTPDRAIRFIEFLKSPQGQKLTQWGIEELHYTLDENGSPVPTDYYKSIPPEQVAQKAGAPNAWYWQGSPLIETILSTAIASAATEGPKPQTNGYLKVVKEATKRMPILSFCNPQPESDELVISTKINELLNNMLPAIYTAKNESEAVAKWEAMYQDAKKIGLDKLEEYYNTAYNANKDKYNK